MTNFVGIANTTHNDGDSVTNQPLDPTDGPRRPDEPKLTDVPDAAVEAAERTLAEFNHDVSGDCAVYVAHAVWLALRASGAGTRQEEPTLADVLGWLRKRPGCSWEATINDINRAIAELAVSRYAESRPNE